VFEVSAKSVDLTIKTLPWLCTEQRRVSTELGMK
jgi:hypothetical protein